MTTLEPHGETLLKVEDLEVRYGAVQALFGARLSVTAGSVTAVLGPNGAGKSTLARAISGLVPCTSGRIVFDDTQISGMPAYRIRRLGITHVPEGRGVFPGLSVSDNLLMAVRRAGTKSQRNDAIERAFDLFPALASRRSQMASSLSGGERQMLSLARALAVSPEIVIADEPSLGLAPKIVDQVFEALARARADGVTVLLIEQFVHRALALADYCVILTQGHVGWSGPASDAKDEVLDRYLGHDAPATSDPPRGV